jgi:hypothetical protein
MISGRELPIGSSTRWTTTCCSVCASGNIDGAGNGARSAQLYPAISYIGWDCTS